MAELLFSLLLVYHSSRLSLEPDDIRLPRIHDIALASVSVCEENPIPGWPKSACVSLVATTAKWESGLLREIHSGERKGPAGEVCLVQLHRSITQAYNQGLTREALSESTGVDYEHTRNCLALGQRVIAYHLHRCAIRYEDGGWYSAAKLYAEYHHPSPYCDAPISKMSIRRGWSYQRMNQALRED